MAMFGRQGDPAGARAFVGRGRRNVRWRDAALLAAFAVVLAGPAAADYAPPAEFTTLYRDFPSSEGKQSIGAMLAESMEDASGDGPLVLVTSSALHVYDPVNRTLIASADFRLAPNSGFIEMTALSHVGPAIAYLAKLRELGDERWRPRLETLLANVRAVRMLNAATTDHWLDRMDQPVFNPHKDAIRAMVDYGAWMAGSYLVSVLDRDGEGFTTASVGADLLAATTGRYPIPFNNVMVGTFVMAALSGQYAVHQAIAGKPIDWREARVVIRAAPGSNLTASLTKGTQAMVPLLRYLSGMTLAEDRIMIVPFAEERASVGGATMPVEDFDYYSLFIWQQPYARRQVAPVAFPGVDTIFLPDRPALPGDYGYTGADDIDHFMVRMKHSFADPREALSNTVAFWVAGELYAKGWDPALLDLPGVSHGFPVGVAGYPADNPPF